MATQIMRVRAASVGWFGAPGLNTIYFAAHGLVSSTAPVLDDAQLAHDRVHAAFTAAAGLYPPAWSMIVSPSVDVLTITNGEIVNSFTVDPSDQIIGDGGAGFGPSAVAALAQLRTGIFDDGSRIQGRAFLGPIVAAADADGTPTSGVVDEVLAWGEALLDAGVTEEPVVVVWRRPRAANAEHLPEPVTARDGMVAKVTSITAPDKYAVLRSRRD